jgi:hypothetical protein
MNLYTYTIKWHFQRCQTPTFFNITLHEYLSIQNNDL